MDLPDELPTVETEIEDKHVEKKGPPAGFIPKEHVSKSEYKKQLRMKAKERKIEAIQHAEPTSSFHEEKRQIVDNLNNNKDDRSRAGKADEDILSFLDTVNSKKNIYTTSSCSGRAIVTQSPGDGYSIDWMYVDHRGELPEGEDIVYQILQPLLSDETPTESVEAPGAVTAIEDEENNDGEHHTRKPPVARKVKGVEIWFKMEPPIVSVSCSDVSTAQNLLDLARSDASLKNCSIRSTNNRHVMVALVDTHRIEAPLAIDGRVLVSREYVEKLFAAAREKLKKGRARFEMMRRAIEEKMEDDDSLDEK
ncbi:hypothetical protein PROFUN_13829 [Planoprotostelium fungivorum]|uniref:tRNA(Phe) 7-[(3-amino-3-carboxypropyl)-4-demethylwyosine(37)-N(4)]-methyltransferase n=1 Tax=Planoprotostelium fungivorum TaxID=1890364 RepID=A0A2P6N2X4_9EUKA|nr:hypothetical protein PROFUN_13829 [Planoprotostelium fungivorum]